MTTSQNGKKNQKKTPPKTEESAELGVAKYRRTPDQNNTAGSGLSPRPIG